MKSHRLELNRTRSAECRENIKKLQTAGRQLTDGGNRWVSAVFSSRPRQENHCEGRPWNFLIRPISMFLMRQRKKTESVRTSAGCLGPRSRTDLHVLLNLNGLTRFCRLQNISTSHRVVLYTNVETLWAPARRPSCRAVTSLSDFTAALKVFL